MANMRVHELAKELNITSKDITDMLSNSEKTYKSVSGLTDAEITSVRKKFAPAPKAENKPAAQPAKQSQPVKNDNRDNRQQNQASKQSQQGTQNKSGNADDKKHISQVYFPQNSSRDKNPRRDNNNRDGQRDNNGGYRNNDRNNGGYRNNDRNNNGGFRNDRNGQSGNGGFRKDNDQNRGGFNGGQRRNNDRRDSAPKEEFDFSAKPDSRRHDSRIDSKKNDRKRDNEAKENLKFANSRFDKKPMTKPEKKEKEEETIKQLVLPDTLTIKELADKMKVAPAALVKKLFLQGKVVTINEEIDYDAAEEIALEFNCICEHEEKVDVIAELLKEDEEPEDKLVPRPPVVCVMGHVDHGKTSLLDAIRETHVTAKESGGITQKIGAYQVNVNGNLITFLDTPGHEAFTAMRARGAKVTDIAIIIVAADDNVMPQTIEAINHASAAGVPIVFAINKIDKPHANPEKIKEELANMNYLVEDWGGKYQSQEISAKKGIGVEELLEKVLLEADLLDLKANPKKRAVGSIIESSLDKGRGYVSTILVENGTLKMGDIVLAGTHQGRIKAMFNERNQRVEKAGPSEPVLILGLNGAPQAGDTFNVLETEQEAREIANRREQLQRELGLRTQKMLTLDDIGRRIAVGNFQELNVIVKGDVDGSVEALSDSLIRLSTEEIQVNVIHKAVGQISESDVVLAAASNAIIIGFQVRPSLQARRNAEKEGVEIRLYSIIYDAIEEVKSAMEGMLSPEIKEEITAYVEVQQVFKITKVGTVAGCMVKEGKIKRTNKIRLIRDGIVIYAGELGSLKRFKDDAKEVVAGLDCGLNITNFNDIQVGDMIEAYEETEIKKTL